MTDLHHRLDRPRRALARSLGVCALALASSSLAASCSEPPPEAALPDPSTVDLAGMGQGTVAGTIDGEPFSTVDARFRVASYRGRERVDLLFSDRAIERCGLPMERPETLVWLRLPGRVQLDPGTYELLSDAPLAEGGEGTAAPSTAAEGTAAEGTAAQAEAPANGDTQAAAGSAEHPMEVHWERPVGEGLDYTIHHQHRGVARVEIETVSPTSIVGRARICFAGDECVAGRFVAAPCWSRIEGRALRESPGLDDGALEPRRQAVQ